MSRGNHVGNLILCDYHKGDNQLFKIVKTDYGQVYFKLKYSNKVLTISAQSEDDGARIV